MPKVITEKMLQKSEQTPLRRKEIYLNDVQLAFYADDAKKNGFTTSKAYIEHILGAFKAAKEHRAKETKVITVKL